MFWHIKDISSTYFLDLLEPLFEPGLAAYRGNVHSISKRDFCPGSSYTCLHSLRVYRQTLFHEQFREQSGSFLQRSTFGSAEIEINYIEKENIHLLRLIVFPPFPGFFCVESKKDIFLFSSSSVFTCVPDRRYIGQLLRYFFANTISHGRCIRSLYPLLPHCCVG